MNGEGLPDDRQPINEIEFTTSAYETGGWSTRIDEFDRQTFRFAFAGFLCVMGGGGPALYIASSFVHSMHSVPH